MSRPKAPYEVTIVLIGPGGTGKSALVIRWVSNHFVTEYDPGIEDMYRKQVKQGDTTILLDIFDTGGREEMTLKQKLRCALECGVFVYDIASLASYQATMKLYDEFRQITDFQSTAAVFVGNKSDLESKREVAFTEAEALLKSKGVLRTMECSCKTASGTQAVLEAVCDVLAPIVRARQAAVDDKKKKKGQACTLL